MSANAQRIKIRDLDPNFGTSDPTAFDRQTAAVLRAFNTWAFKRSQPSEPDLLAQTVASRIAQADPISFVLYWGKGPRDRVGAPEFTCLDYLAAMGARIAKAYGPGAHFNLCLTDTHARLNGHSEESIDWYFDGVAEAAALRGMASERLSRLTEGLEHIPDGDLHHDEQMLESLERCAARWYRGIGDVREGARTYLAMNRVESRAVAARYRGSIFVTFNGPTYREMFPDTLPVFYMYSLRRGTAVKPWFMNEECMPYTDADANDTLGAA
ncbi:MAG TPA: hypothetical protein P5114_03310 [Hyphomicrobiaceae bacterium]|nr:hypothetical protein [Hyphomicrobiaceae bacterium]